MDSLFSWCSVILEHYTYNHYTISTICRICCVKWDRPVAISLFGFAFTRRRSHISYQSILRLLQTQLNPEKQFQSHRYDGNNAHKEEVKKCQLWMRWDEMERLLYEVVEAELKLKESLTQHPELQQYHQCLDHNCLKYEWKWPNLAYHSISDPLTVLSADSNDMLWFLFDWEASSNNLIIIKSLLSLHSLELLPPEPHIWSTFA